MYIAVAYILVSITMWIVARFSPFEWQIRNESEENWLNGRNDREMIDAPYPPALHQCKHNQQTNDQNDIDSVDDAIPDEADALFDGDKTMKKSNRESEESINDSDAIEDGQPNYPDLFSGTKECLNPQRNAGQNLVGSCCEHEAYEFVENELQSVENDFTLRNSFWFAIGTLMQQGSDLNPKVKPISILFYVQC